MYKRLLIALVPGLVTSLLAALLVNAWTHLSVVAQVLIALAIGVATIAFVVTITHGDRSYAMRVASRIRSQRSVRVSGVEVKGARDANVEVASDISAKEGDVEITDITVKKGDDQDAGNPG
jgi:hypothetical protein